MKNYYYHQHRTAWPPTTRGQPLAQDINTNNNSQDDHQGINHRGPSIEGPTYGKSETVKTITVNFYCAKNTERFTDRRRSGRSRTIKERWPGNLNATSSVGLSVGAAARLSVHPLNIPQSTNKVSHKYPAISCLLLPSSALCYFMACPAKVKAQKEDKWETFPWRALL